MTFDERRMAELMEASEDLHSDAMRVTTTAMTEMVEAGHERRAMKRSDDVDPGRRTFLRRSLFAAGTVAGVGFGAGMLRGATANVFAAGTEDVQLLQTAASIENLAVAVYTQAAGLPPAVSGASNAVILKFVQTTIAQHTDHAKQFNAALTALGAKTQTGIDTAVMTAVVTPALAKITKPADVIGLAQTLEDAAAQTYVQFGSLATAPEVLAPFAVIAPVEAQHSAVLLAVKALLDGGAPLASITLPPADLAALPAAAGSVGFPKSFYSTEGARPMDEGAVK